MVEQRRDKGQEVRGVTGRRQQQWGQEVAGANGPGKISAFVRFCWKSCGERWWDAEGGMLGSAQGLFGGTGGRQENLKSPEGPQ